MDWQEYEQIASQIAESVYKHVEGATPNQMKYGRKNRWRGESGFEHQTDVSVSGPKDLILVECKYWTNEIKAEHLLTFAGRIDDIRQVLSDQVTIHPIMVTKTGFQSGVETLAKHYHIDLRLIQSPGDFDFQYKGVGNAGSTQPAYLKGALPSQPKNPEQGEKE